MLVTIIGRGHSGTRLIARTLHDSGVFMGEPLNDYFDLMTYPPMLDAARIAARHVRYLGDLRWNFAHMNDCGIDTEAIRLAYQTLEPVLASRCPISGWKIPETCFLFPWLVRMFPTMKFIHWVRDPRDCILRFHPSDDLRGMGVEFPEPFHPLMLREPKWFYFDFHDDWLDPALRSILRLRRIASWKYQAQVVSATPQPENIITIRFEDFVMEQQETIGRLEEFLCIRLARVPVYPESIGRWRRVLPHDEFPELQDDLDRFGYVNHVKEQKEKYCVSC